MEKAGVLIEKLQQQLADGTDVHKLLMTAQLLHSELLMQAKITNGVEYRKVAMMVPHAVAVTQNFAPVDETVAGYKPVPKPDMEPEPLPDAVSEPEMPLPEPAPLPTPKPEPEPIPHFVEQDPWERLFVAKEEKPASWAADTMMEFPTLAHQQKVVYELNDVMNEEVSSVNDKLKQEKVELGSTLVDAPVKDLKKAIGINDRHRFINELFRGDETMYERSVKTINGFHIFAEAEYWIQRELKVKLGWDTTLELVKTFDQLVKRRFA